MRPGKRSNRKPTAASAPSSLEASGVPRPVATRWIEVKTSVSAHLDYLVIGDGAFVEFSAGFRSSKLDTALNLRESGAPIEIIPEQDFLQLLLS